MEENRDRPRLLPSSFRDPGGFLFTHRGVIYRQVNISCKESYDELMESGLYDSLIEKGWLIPHQEVSLPEHGQDHHYKTLLPEQIPYISYPYEWCFSQLKDAALLTLDIQLEALRHGMILKDATAYNVQFHKGRPVFIDTLSFVSYMDGDPWIAYRQFCQHFLAPLMLIVQCDFRLLHMLRAYIDGIPLDLASQLLPGKSWFSYSILAHVHLHAKTQKQFENSAGSANQGRMVSMSRARLEGLISSLQSAVQNQRWKYAGTQWADYYDETNYVDRSMLHKEELVSRLLAECEKSDTPIAADFGANTGKFSRLAADAGFYVLSQDIDEVAVDKNYRKTVDDNEDSILPLMLDLTNPSPGLGWVNTERMSFMERQKVDVGMALALIHHIAISNNVPLNYIAELFAKVCRYLIIEFVPKSDSQVERLLATREDVFPDYNQTGFETAFLPLFKTLQKISIQDSERTLYLMRLKK